MTRARPHIGADHMTDVTDEEIRELEQDLRAYRSAGVRGARLTICTRAADLLARLPARHRTNHTMPNSVVEAVRMAMNTLAIEGFANEAEGLRQALANLSQQPQAEGLLDEFAKHTNWELSFDGWDEAVWQVHQVNGGRNDREWSCIATGDTPHDAISAALKEQTDEQG